MSILFFTILIAFVFVLIALALLAIGWLMTGKSRIKPGACGRDPNKMRDENCSENDVSCGLCKNNEKDKK